MDYEFSTPLPFNKEHIDYLLKINQLVQKSKITSLYFSLPTNSVDFTGFEQDRYIWDFITDYNYWKPLIEYSIKNGFDFVYVLNSPIVYNYNYENLNQNLEKLDRLLNNLKNSGCNKIRVANLQLMGYISHKFPDIELYISTSTELKIISEYINLLSLFRNIKEIVPSWDLNKNFKLLKNLKIKFPNIKIELMVNEGCLPSCPFRRLHNNWFNVKTNHQNSNFYFTNSFFKHTCKRRMDNDLLYYLFYSNLIYPWNISEYSSIGIYKFKLVGRNNLDFKKGDYLAFYKYYLQGVDNIHNIENIPVRFFNNFLLKYKNLNITVKDYKKYLPKLSYFKKYGHLCSSICGIECRYCFKCAEKIQKVCEKKQKEEMKRTIPICFIEK